MYSESGISLVLFRLLSLPSFVLAVLVVLSGCEAEAPIPGLETIDKRSKPATAYTQTMNRELLQQLPFSDRQDFDNATRGFIATNKGARTIDANGATVFSLEGMRFLEGDAPDTVNPSLWRQAQLNALLHGLFEVEEGIYQVRSFDLANMTLIRGTTGWIIIDPLLTSETAAAALALANRELGERPVTAVVFTHSHIDHFGGVAGVVTPQDIASGKIPLIAPKGFSAEALSENLRAGNVMQRRAAYQFGSLLPDSATGFVSTGLGNKTAEGEIIPIAPNQVVPEEGATLILDGVEFEFMNTPGAEAPAELIFYLPAWRALSMAELATHTLHNIYTLRGAKTRDANLWSQHIQRAIDTWGSNTDVVFASHHWPTWGQEDALDYLHAQRDLYKYIHDQTLRLANHGYTMVEIAEQIELPDALANRFANRGYYGTVNHGVKAVYNYYLGWFDGNPSNLHPLPAQTSASKYIEYMGGSRAILERAAKDQAAGEYRWVAEVLRHLVFAEPDNETARYLLADSYEQLGYQAESGIWRNFYLSGALELRQGVEQLPNALAPKEALLRGVSLADFIDAMAVRLDGEAAAESNIELGIHFTDLDSHWLLSVSNGVLHGLPNRKSEDPDVSLTLTSNDFKFLLSGLVGAPTMISEGRLKMSGNPLTLIRFAGLFDQFDSNFNIVTP